MTDYFRIVVTRRGTKDKAYDKGFLGTQNEMEIEAGKIWTNEGFGSQPDRFRLKAYPEGSRAATMTIE